MSEKMKILIGYDGTKGADLALDDLRRAGLPREAEVLVVSVTEPSFVLSGPGSLEMIIARDSIFGKEKAEKLAEKAVGRIRSDFPGWRVEKAVVPGSPSESLIVKADEWGADLLVVGSHGHTALGRFFLGSVSQSVVAHARCSARVARFSPHKQTADPDSPVRIVIGVDGSPGADAAVRAVASRQWPQGSEALVVDGLRSIPPVSEEEEMHEHIAMQAAEWVAREKPVAEAIVESVAEQLKAAGLATTAIIKVEEPKRLLLSEAERWNADCIFVGARGLSRLKRLLLGSVSMAVVPRAQCSVEVVRAK
ncbi:MAG TPA: universal stress protein [Blastocatellia bacterium]|nr:universal stress protein [Blastocatellia bacterium]